MKRKLFINGGFALAIVILTIIWWQNYVNIKDMAGEERWEHHTYAVSRGFDELLIDLEVVENGANGFVITGREGFLKEYHAALGRIDQMLPFLRGLMNEDPRHEGRLAGIEPLIRKKLAGVGRTVELRRTAGFQAAYQAVVEESDQNLMNEIRRRVTAARLEEEQLLTKLNEEEYECIKEILVTTSAGSIVSFSLLITVFLLMRREIDQRVKAEEELCRHRDHLDRLVQERTAELVQAKLEAEAANHAKSEFLENMSHEMRTPLTGIKGIVDLMLTEGLTDEHHHNMEMARSSAETLNSLINDILDYSKISTGMMSFENRPFDLRACVRSVADMFAIRAERKGLRFILEIDDNLPVQVVGDGRRFLQVLENLLRNAVKFTSSGEIGVSIRTDHDPARPDQDVLQVTVRDTGTGIPAEYQESIFELFTQADASSTKRFGGIGLGLALSKQIVEKMGGKIRCESRLGVGSIFSFTLPFPGMMTDSAAP